ncbi:MAG: IS1634 family transposase [Firmicutes bacterium]|nr:IS1634 family transposase [Bacillota bacterium]
MPYNIDMYIRTTTRTNKDGSVVRYLQLAHNEWDSEAGRSRVRVLFNLGREEKVDKEGLRRLVKSISRFLSPEEAARSQVEGVDGLRFISSKPMGGAWFLDCVWRQLGIDRVLGRLLKAREFQAPVERAIFAMVANRALSPMSKLAIEDWVEEEVLIPGLTEVAAHQLYRAMDFLLLASEELQKEVFFNVADLLNLEVDLLYFDTTSTYFEVEEEDEEKDGLRRRGHSKDHRPDLPQAVIGLAVTRTGIPVRCWVWPGNTADMSVIKQVKDDLVGWRLGRVITVVDRGFSSEENLRYLQRAGGHYIAGERLRTAKGATDVVSRAGRYKVVKENMQVKEIIMGDGEARKRYILVYNPEEAERDKANRERALSRIREELDRIGELNGAPHTKACCQLIAHETYGRYLKTDRLGQPRIDKAKVKAEELLDGKYLLSTSDDTLSPEDVALGYKQLLEVEDAFRMLKSALDMRPVYHRLEERIRAHVLLCWMALLLIRVAETKTGKLWRYQRRHLEMMHAIEFGSNATRVMQRTETTAIQKQLFAAVGIQEPPRILDLYSPAKA